MAEKPKSPNKIAPLTWVAFSAPGARLHSNAQYTEAVVADGQTKLWLAEHGGLHVILIEDSTFPSPARIPLSACVGYGE